MRWDRSTLFLIALLMLCATRAQARPTAEVDWAALAGRYGATVEAFPDDASYRLQYAYALLMLGRYDDAAAEYGHAAALDLSAFEARLGLVDALSAAGRVQEALDASTENLGLRPRHRGTLNRHAWLLFQLRHYQEARAAYGMTRAFYPDDVDARLGEAWCALRLGEVKAARAGFEATLTARPGDASAEAGRALLAPRAVFTPAVYGIVQRNSDTATTTWTAGTVASMEALFDGRWRAGALYRHLSVTGREGALIDDVSVDFTQHEAYAWLGYERLTWGVSLLGVYVDNAQDTVLEGESEWNPQVGALAIKARGRAWADLRSAFAHSFYDDADVTQVALGADLPLLSWLALRLDGATQLVDGEAHLSGDAELRVSSRLGFVGAGGGLGARHRPLDTEGHTLYNIAQPLSGRLRAHGLWRFSGDWGLYAGYELERYDALTDDETLGDRDAYTAHRLSLGLTTSF
jgi:tetratricopeptide (TPR) repeat protein